MKFIHYIERVSGVSMYGLTSLLLFATIFGVMLWYAVRADKCVIEEIRQMPLDDDNLPQ
ncbi:MAG TPA: hypothetical protein VN616_12235 [Puia sp.]|nr:hypothetical protein [Puia sp.]